MRGNKRFEVLIILQEVVLVNGFDLIVSCEMNK